MDSPEIQEAAPKQVLVVDATVVLKWFTPEIDDAVCLKLLDMPDLEMHAPTLLASQVGLALHRRFRSGQVPKGTARQVSATLAKLPIQWTPDTYLVHDAIRISTQTNRSFGDSLYLALALRKNATLVSGDRRWCSMMSTGSTRDWIRFVGQYLEDRS